MRSRSQGVEGIHHRREGIRPARPQRPWLGSGLNTGWRGPFASSKLLIHGGIKAMAHVFSRSICWSFPIIAIFLLSLQPAFGQQKTPWGTDIFPGEEKQWFANPVHAYKEQDEANKELARLKGLGIQSASLWVKPWLLANNDSMSLFVMIGPFASEAAAEKAADEAKRRTGKNYVTSYFPGILRTDKAGDAIYFPVVAAFDTFGEADSEWTRAKKAGFEGIGVQGFFNIKGKFLWAAVGNGYREKGNAAKVAADLKRAGFLNTEVLKIDWELIERLETGRVAYQSKTMGRSRNSEGAYGYDYKYQQWKNCVDRHSNQPWSGNQVGMGWAKCGDAPKP